MLLSVSYTKWTMKLLAGTQLLIKNVFEEWLIYKLFVWHRFFDIFCWCHYIYFILKICFRFWRRWQPDRITCVWLKSQIEIRTTSARFEGKIEPTYAQIKDPAGMSTRERRPHPLKKLRIYELKKSFKKYGIVSMAKQLKALYFWTSILFTLDKKNYVLLNFSMEIINKLEIYSSVFMNYKTQVIVYSYNANLKMV